MNSTAWRNERLSSSKQGNSDSEWARLDPDPVLDRYNNIHPWANNRIKLQVPEGVNDYINASPVTLVSTSGKQSALKSGVQDKYICMQGPKKQTVDHVWHMVWHEIATPFNSSPAVILMLSPTHCTRPKRPSQDIREVFPVLPTRRELTTAQDQREERPRRRLQGRSSFCFPRTWHRRHCD
jgi:protein-tyrosine phosphatase